MQHFRFEAEKMLCSRCSMCYTSVSISLKSCLISLAHNAILRKNAFELRQQKLAHSCFEAPYCTRLMSTLFKHIWYFSGIEWLVQAYTKSFLLLYSLLLYLPPVIQAALDAGLVFFWKSTWPTSKIVQHNSHKPSIGHIHAWNLFRRTIWQAVIPAIQNIQLCSPGFILPQIK